MSVSSLLRATVIAVGPPVQIKIDGADSPINAIGGERYKPVVGDRVSVHKMVTSNALSGATQMVIDKKLANYDSSQMIRPIFAGDVQIQAGAVAFTTSAGFGGANFNTAFTNGCIACVLTVVVGGNARYATINTVSNTSFGCLVYDGAGNLFSGTVAVHYVAYGQ